MDRRVVITGMGAITPLGNNVQIFWDALSAGKSGIARIVKFDVTEFSSQIAGCVKGFTPEDHLDKKDARRMDRFTQFAVAACKEAISCSGLNLDNVDKERLGVILGTGIGGIETLENQINVLKEKGPARVSALTIPMMIANMAAGQISIETGAKGVNLTIVTACAASTNAIGEAFKTISCGQADIIITGGSEAPLTPTSLAGFCSMKATSTANERPQEACRPFDAHRDGFVMGEGAGIIILESHSHAVARGARILAEIVGYGVTADAFHITAPAPNGEGGARAMKQALSNARVSPCLVGYINAHGTSTPYNDKFETAAIKDVFGKHAFRLAVSSTKSMTGHLLGAAGGIEAIALIKSLTEQFIPPTINYTTPDPDCDLDYVPNIGRKAEIEYAMSNSFGFGGHNASILMKRYVQ